jgi:DDE superfamily endonuclease/Helix-turn-helix of DDE superfamily endonuclease
LGQTNTIFCINIVINYTDISGCPKKFVAVTTLYESEFTEILSYFSERWRIHESRYTLSNTWRVNKPRKDETLKLVEDKLLFILYYFKNYPIQETMGLNFGMSQGKVSIWIKVLLPILQETLAKFGDLPARDGTTLDVILKESGQEKFYLDGTVRPVQRSIDYELQKEYYTGKQCTHVVKNDLLNDKNRRVWWISDTYEGSIHDKKVMDLENCKFPKGITLVYDTGFQNLLYDGVSILQPHKAQRNAPLVPIQKKINTIISSERVVNEHTIGSVKRPHILKHELRINNLDFRDNIFWIGCGLHNLRIRHRTKT